MTVPVIVFRSHGQNDRHSGRWWPVQMQGHDIAGISCPGCGRVGLLAPPEYEIASDGAVTPSMVCPYNCGFREHVWLDGWRHDP